MKEYCVTVEFCNYNQREQYFVEADTEEKAKEEALEEAIEDLEIVNIENETKNDRLESKIPKCKNYILTQVDKNEERFTILSSADAVHLIKIAEKIILPNAKRIEVLGNDGYTKNTGKVIFTKEL